MKIRHVAWAIARGACVILTGSALFSGGGSAVFAQSPAAPWRLTQDDFRTSLSEPGGEAERTDEDASRAEREGFALDMPLRLRGPQGEVDLPVIDATDEEPPSPAEEPVRMLLYEAMLNVQDGHYAEAVPKLEWVIENNPALNGAWETLGYAYWSMGRREDARLLWEKWKRIAPREPSPYRLLAQTAVAQEDLDRAETLYRQSLERSPGHYEIRFSLARVLLWNGKFEAALDKLQVLHAEDEERLDVALQLARALFAMEEYEASLVHWNRINEQVPDFPDYMLARARALFQAGMLHEARDEAEALLEIEPDRRGAINLLGDIAMRAQDYRQVADAMQRAIDLAESREAKADPARRLAYYAAARRERDPAAFTLSECLRFAREAHELEPDDVNGKLFYAELLVIDGQHAAAEDMFHSVLEHLNPHSRRARYGLFLAAMGRMDLDSAEERLRAYLRALNPSDPYRHLLWARLHFARGRWHDAKEALDRLEWEGARGSVFTLLYHGLSSGEWSPMPSVRQFRDHMMTLKAAGFRFLTPGEFDAYFESLAPPERVPRRPLLNRLWRSMRFAWTGERDDEPPMLYDHVPDRAVAVTFDDGLRSSFRWATPAAEDLRIPMTMFVSVGHIVDRDIYIVTVPELKAYYDTGWWEIGSHLVDASYPARRERDGRPAHHPLPNRIWLEDQDRLETFREYHRRVRHEFGESRRFLSEALELPAAEISSIAYPMGDIGQSTDSNIELFNVPEIILNEAEIHYRRGFLQTRYGYSLKLDYPMMLQRWEPDREDEGEEVLRHALRNHPVFLARRTRAEMAALQGEMHQALHMIELLRRDGYPRRDLNELSDYVHARLARLAPAPQAVRADPEGREKRVLEPRHPYLGIEGYTRKANVMIDEWHAALKAGVRINPSLTLEGRVGLGSVKQEVSSETWIEVRQTLPQDGGDGEGEETVIRGLRAVEARDYRATEEMAGLALYYVFPAGSIGSLDVRRRAFGGDLEDEAAFTYAVDYAWRPVLSLDLFARYERDVIPSAREKITYDGAALGAIWRARDVWHVSGHSAYHSLSDDNSLLRLMLENYWRMSELHDLWLGLHHSVVTADRESDIYWTPYWDQRHYAMLRWRRTYPNFYAMIRAQVGIQRYRGRTEEWARYRERLYRARVQEWYPGAPPDEEWHRLMGLAGSLRRRWANGLEAQAEISVNALKEHTERTATGSLLYRF